MTTPFDLEKALEDAATHDDILSALTKAEDEGVNDPARWLQDDLLPILRSLQARIMDLAERLSEVEDDTDEALDRLDRGGASTPEGMVAIPIELASTLLALCSSVGLDLPLGRTGDTVIPQAEVARVARTLFLSLRSVLEQRPFPDVLEEVAALYPTLALKQEFPQGEA